MGNMFSSGAVKVRRNHYAHIFDGKTNAVRAIVGPQSYSLSATEASLFDPKPFAAVPQNYYCTVRNPVIRVSTSNEVATDASGQAQLRMGDSEIRITCDPFPLYPGEELVQHPTLGTMVKLTAIGANRGLRLRCVRDFVNESGETVRAGTEWMDFGPKTYIPRVEVEECGVVEASMIKSDSALKIGALRNFTDRHGKARLAGEQWIEKTPGAYIPSVEEELLEVVKGIIVHETRAVQLCATQNFTDAYGRARKAGDMWLITNKDTSVHIPDVHETVMKEVSLYILSADRYCIVLNPVGPDGKNRYGQREVRRGERSFFLMPEEKLVDGIQEVLAVGREEALLLKAREPFQDGETLRQAGTMWLLRGPTEYVPNNSVKLVEKREMITLDKNEGIYVMNRNSGEVRTVIGQPYMPTEDEVLWEKRLPMAVEELLAAPGGSLKTSQRDACFDSTRELFRIVRFNVQHNAAVQIYDYHKKAPRIVFGPDLVMLAPHEELTVLSLSGGKPKIPNAIQSLQLFLGPRFSSDTIIVETSDHARLQLRLSYNWFFDVQRGGADQQAQCRCFSVPDFIGDCCKTIASRVRGAVAGEDFDSFHRNSAMIIRTAVFGVDERGDIRKELRFSANDFVVTNVDVQFAEPTDAKTRDSLQKSVQLAIEITTKSLEATARHGNELKDQEAKGQLERQKLLDKIEVEKAKTTWLELQAKSEAVQASGQSVTEAKAKSEALLIEVNSELKQAKLRSEAYKISAESELSKLEQRQAMELEYMQRQNALEVDRAQRTAESEAEKVRRMVGAVGKDTIVAIARAGPEMQAKLLAGLGLKGYLITDGNSPVNLFNAAQGMLGEAPGSSIEKRA